MIERQSPNILFITADQLRQDALGCYGNPLIQTPNVDALAEQGVRFERMFAAYPVCAPNRASIVTGRYPSVHRLRSNGMRLPKCELTLMQVLRAAGYRTYGSGKMHFGPQWQFPADGSPIMDPDPSTAIDPQPGEDEFPWYGFDHVWVTEDHRMGPYGRSNQPFFLWVSYVHPHHPFNPPAPYDTMYDPADMPLPLWCESEVEGWPQAYRRKHFARKGGHEAIGMCDLQDEDWQRIVAYYYGMISQIDKNIGRLFDALSRHGQLENTVIVFAADHGENLGDHHLLFKGTTYDCVTKWQSQLLHLLIRLMAENVDPLPPREGPW